MLKPLKYSSCFFVVEMILLLIYIPCLVSIALRYARIWIWISL